MARCNDIRFAELIDRATDIALEHELYEAVPLLDLDGKGLDSFWKGATREDVARYRWCVDMAWREHILQTARINELLSVL